MSDLIVKKETKQVLENEYRYLEDVLDKDDLECFKQLTPELKDTWSKKQLFRTETEMRVSVLNDYKFPTKASKYWQCVREQDVHLDCLLSLSIDNRKNDVKIKKLQKSIEECKDELDKELLKIELDERILDYARVKNTARHRIREIRLWSKLKEELDDGTFDTKNPDTHKRESLKSIINNRVKSFTPGTSMPEIFNTLALQDTYEKVIKENQIKNYDQEREKLLSQKSKTE